MNYEAYGGKMKVNPWIEFLKANGGHGKSMSQLQFEYNIKHKNTKKTKPRKMSIVSYETQMTCRRKPEPICKSNPNQCYWKPKAEYCSRYSKSRQAPTQLPTRVSAPAPAPVLKGCNKYSSMNACDDTNECYWNQVDDKCVPRYDFDNVPEN